MSQLPPVVRESEFLAIDTVIQNEIRTRFDPFIRDLHSFLNQLPSLRDIQLVRLKWKTRVKYKEAFGNFATSSKHWYTYNHGGRNEAQFNIGLFTTYLRVGLGFEFTRKKWGNPRAVHLAYTCFTKVIRSELEGFKRFVRNNSLKVEWFHANSKGLEFVPTKEIEQWLLHPSIEPLWIFIGRLLWRRTDAIILEDSVKLKHIIESILGGFRPIWEQTQVMTALQQ